MIFVSKRGGGGRIHVWGGLLAETAALSGDGCFPEAEMVSLSAGGGGCGLHWMVVEGVSIWI